MVICSGRIICSFFLWYFLTPPLSYIDLKIDTTIRSYACLDLNKRTSPGEGLLKSQWVKEIYFPNPLSKGKHLCSEVLLILNFWIQIFHKSEFSLGKTNLIYFADLYWQIILNLISWSVLLKTFTIVRNILTTQFIKFSRF